MSGGWLASYVVIWAVVVVLALAVAVLLRQIGILHARLEPLGAHFAGEGPRLDEPAPPLPDRPWSRTTLVAFTSPSCEVCERLRPSLAALGRQYRDVSLVELELGDDTRSTFAAFEVRSTPYVVVVAADGVVRGRGVVNSMEQVEELVARSLRRAEAPT